MSDPSAYLQCIREQGYLPLFYHDDAATCLRIARTLHDAGVRVIEFTNRGGRAVDNFRALRGAVAADMPGMTLSVGTVKTSLDAERFFSEGADILISPVFDEGVADAVARHGIPWIPGCMTPTEIHRAAQAGCAMIKLFPGNLIGPGYVEAVRPVFPGLQFVVTGGVEPEEGNLSAWFRSGVAAVGMGSRLIPSKPAWTEDDYRALGEKAEALRSMLGRVRGTGEGKGGSIRGYA